MNEDARKSFEKNWGKFTTRLRGEMLQESKKQKLSHSFLKLMLANQMDFWNSEDSEGGRWLDSFEKDNPQRGKLVRNILENDVAFSKEFSRNSYGDFVRYTLPLGCAVAGLLISHSLSHTRQVKAAAEVAATLIPGVAAYPIANGISVSMKQQAEKEMINFYIGQLDKYKVSIERILMDPETK